MIRTRLICGMMLLLSIIPILAQQLIIETTILSETHRYEARQNGEGIYQYSTKILIGQKKDIDLGNISLPDNPLYHIPKNAIYGSVTDLVGNEIYKLKKDDISEGFYYDANIYSDTKRLYFELSHNNFPYIIEYGYKQELKSLFFWPDYYPRRKFPVKKSEYTLSIPSSLKFNYFTKGIEAEPELKAQGNTTLYTWRLADIEAFDPAPLTPPEYKRPIFVKFAPSRFNLRGYIGSFDSWGDFGNWYQQLLSGRSVLNPELKDRVKELTQSETSDSAKIANIYRYMQEQTRYVAMGIDITGWQPHSAIDTYQNKYGDCKDLSNLTVSMLREAGIEAYSALILTRDQGLTDPDIPFNQFNHCIAMVPQATDTLWLECTSDMLAAGAPSFSIEGANALLIDGKNSRIIKTPESRAAENRQITRLNGEIDGRGNLGVTGSIRFEGNQANRIRSYLSAFDPDEEKKFAIRYLSSQFSEVDLQTYRFVNVDSNLALPITFEFMFQAPKAFKVSRKRLFFNSNFFERQDKSVRMTDSTRTAPIFYYYAFQDIDSVSIKIPPGYQVEASPKSLIIDEQYWSYNNSYRLEGNQFYYVRDEAIKQRLIPASSYTEYQAFMKTVRKNENAKYVLVRR